MPLLCNEDDSLVANVFDAYVRKPQAELLYFKNEYMSQLLI